MCNTAIHTWSETGQYLFVSLLSPYVREFLSLDNPKNAQQQDFDMQPGADEGDAPVGTVHVQLTLSLPSSKCRFSQSFKSEMYEWCGENQ